MILLVLKKFKVYKNVDNIGVIKFYLELGSLILLV